jgi:hypothetical protein
LLPDKTEYTDLGGDDFERGDRRRLTRQLIRRLEGLRHTIVLEPEPQLPEGNFKAKRPEKVSGVGFSADPAAPHCRRSSVDRRTSPAGG